VRLAEDAGVEVRKGILVDERMATSVPDVYAAGDAVNFKGQLLAIVVTAQEQARVAAANMAGEEKSYGGVPASTSLKVLDIDVNSMGEVHPEQEDFEGFEEVRVSDPDALTYKKIVLFEGKIVGAIVIGDPQLAKKLDRMISDAVPMTADAARSLLAGEG
jgi:NAD(P)H-nitrite reductase large subunit